VTLFALLGAVFTFPAVGLVRTQWSARRLSELNWDDLLTELKPVETDGITAVAVEYLNPEKFQVEMKQNDIWSMIGGAEGLTRRRANTDVLLALAAYAKRWNPEEGGVVAERKGRDAMALCRAVSGIGIGMTCGYGKRRVPSYIREAAGAYYLMRQRVPALYRASESGLYSNLANAV
jgi:hypothetical protein